MIPQGISLFRDSLIYKENTEALIEKFFGLKGNTQRTDLDDHDDFGAF